MLRQPCKLGVRSGAREDLGVFFSSGAPALSFKRTLNDERTAPRVAGCNRPVHKLNELVWQPDSDLLAHPNMVANCYQSGRDPARTIVAVPPGREASLGTQLRSGRLLDRGFGITWLY
jgi:hypothetical protein